MSTPKLLLHAVFKDGSRTSKVEVDYRVEVSESGRKAYLIPTRLKSLKAHRSGEVSHFVWELPGVPGLMVPNRLKPGTSCKVKLGETFTLEPDDKAITLEVVDDAS